MTHYSRTDWGARPARAKYPLDPGDVVGIALHWPGITSRLTTPNAVHRSLQAWQRLHMDARGWSDIAYQVAIDQAGNTYRLRGLRFRSGANGDDDVNRRYGALLLVVAEGEKPTEELIRAVRGRVAAFQERFPHARRVVGHQDVRPEPTACPGPALMRLIEAGAFTPKKG